MAGTCASVLVEYPRAEAWLREGVEYAERVELWNHRHYMAAHLAHVAWATGDMRTAEGIAFHVLADGRGGITTRITALYVLGYVALVRADWDRAKSLLEDARSLGEEMAELQRYSPPLWGLAELALLRGEHDRAVELTARGFEASHAVEDAAYLFPFLVTGTRARLAARDPLAAERWVSTVGADLEARSIPGTLPAIAHARGLVALAGGATGEARVALEQAAADWAARRRAWEGAWATVDLARCAARTNRTAYATRHRMAAIEAARAMGSPSLVEAAERIPADHRRRAGIEEPWSPLTAREFEVARLVADGWTNPDIAAELGISPRTAASHVEHILAKLGATRRAGIGAWVATIQPSRAPVPVTRS
jgi:DNA-binding CsgD family transcriptional regulator